jgi:hypothetical protein
MIAQAIDVGLGITKGMAYLQSLSVSFQLFSSDKIHLK